MAQKLTASLPPDFDLGANFIISLTAVDPSSGALVAGVNVSNVALMTAALTSAASDGDEGSSGPLVVPFMLVPGPEG